VNASVDGVSVLDASLLPGGSFDYDVVKMLVDKGADCSKGYPLNRVVKELTMCRNPIDGTADLEREEFLLDCIDVLAAGGVDVNANAEGNTPLMLAITAGQARAVHRLASVGANIHDENIIGKLCRKLRTLSEEPGQERELQFLGQSIVTVIEAGADVNATWGNVYPKNSHWCCQDIERQVQRQFLHRASDGCWQRGCC
jgi:ankyrin repeat protein